MLAQDLLDTLSFVESTHSQQSQEVIKRSVGREIEGSISLFASNQAMSRCTNDENSEVV